MITAVVLTHNNQKTIAKCLSSLWWCDEIIVVDDYSHDKTLEIANKFNTKNYSRRLKHDYSAQRNYGLSKVKKGWVLFVDSDEVVTKKLGREIRESIKSSKYSAYYIKRKNLLLGKVLNNGEWGRNKFVRLAYTDSGKWKRSVHEFWDVKVKTGQTDSYILHNQSKTLSELINDISRYSKIHYEEKHDSGHSFLKVLTMPVFKFVKNEFFSLGIKDGTHGFVIAVIMSFHSFLAWSALCLKEAKKTL